ncbi:GTPase RsgA [Mycobacteroides abscessus subsp. abscessus]|nr:GTPase RsgA [Mycobacteroides abscessus subsp. abscessus]
MREAIEAGVLTARRLASYRKLAKENAWMAARTDANATTGAENRGIGDPPVPFLSERYATSCIAADLPLP